MTRTQRVLSWFPGRIRIPDAEWDRRHRTLVSLLAIQIPLVFLFGMWRGHGQLALLLELAAPIATVLIALWARLGRRLRAATVSAGLVLLSAGLVHLSGGYVEAHLHLLVMLGFIALYRDWVPLGSAVGVVVLGHGVLTGWDLDSLFNHASAPQQPLLWAGLYGTAVAFATLGHLTAWKAAERATEAEARSREVAAAARRDAIAQLYVDLSRRNGALVEKQLTVIDRLERQVRDSDLLGHLFELDHLTTRVRRNGESLLVVAGADPVVTRRDPMALVDVARGAVSEVDQYARVDVEVDLEVQLLGPAVRDVAHLLAELVENGTAFSPPRSRVTIAAHPAEDGSVVLTVEDRGLGMAPDALATANDRFADPEELSVETSRHLGHHVVARLAAKHDVAVSLHPTDGGGTTAVVALPAALVYTPMGAPSVAEIATAGTADADRVGDTTPSEREPAAAVPAPEAVNGHPSDAHEQDDPAAAAAGAGILDDLLSTPWEGEATPVGAVATTPASMSFTAGNPRRRKRKGEDEDAPPLAAVGATPEVDVTPVFVSPPAADVAATLPARGDAPGLPTRRPGATHAAARATGLFGSHADIVVRDESGAATNGSTASSNSSRSSLQALSNYQQAQRAVRGNDPEEPQ